MQDARTNITFEDLYFLKRLEKSLYQPYWDESLDPLLEGMLFSEDFLFYQEKPFWLSHAYWNRVLAFGENLMSRCKCWQSIYKEY